MPIPLSVPQKKLAARINSLDKAFERHILEPKMTRRVDRFALQEGLISALWQSWGWFCRQATINSALGAFTRAGVLTTSSHTHLNEMQVAYICKQLARGTSTNTVRTLSGSHQEPTWGHPQKITLIAVGLATSNGATLAGAFSGCSAIVDLHICRNASAHLGSDTLNAVRTARVRYNHTDMNHPSDMMKWIDPVSKDFLWKEWVDEILLISELCIE